MGGYSKTCQRRGGTTSLLLNPFGRQESDDISLSNRRKLISLLPSSIVITTTLSILPNNIAEAKCKPSNELINTRMQLDLAVQASQSWVDAEEIANDTQLDEENLLRALKSCNNNTSQSSGGDEIILKVLESVKKMRSIVAKEGKNTDDAMTFMRYGTSARAAVDSYMSSD